MSTPAPEPTLASRNEVLVALNELLEAERAGARVAMETARDMPPCPSGQILGSCRRRTTGTSSGSTHGTRGHRGSGRASCASTLAHV